MAYEQRNISGLINSDATFRTWGSTVSDLWQDVGLTKTADTGQIDWTSVVRVSSTLVGYEIFRLTTDTEQSNFGLYIRVDYGTGGTTLQRLRIQIGESTDGAGNLTGKVGTARTFGAIGTADNSTRPHYCVAGDGYFAYVGSSVPGTSLNTALNNCVFIIERLRDNTGAPTADGVYTLFGSGGDTALAGVSQIVRPDDINPPYSRTTSFLRLGAFVPDLSGNRGTDLYLYTHQPADYAIYNPCLSNLFYYHTDLTAGININVDMYGSSRTFKPLGRLTTGTSWPSNAFGHENAGLALLWE